MSNTEHFNANLMANAQLAAQHLRSLVSYNPETGEFRWLRTVARNVKQGVVCGGKPASNGYLRLKMFGKNCAQHRLAWLHFYGEWPKNNIDHIDGCRTNNAIRNLRDVPTIVNCQNLRFALPTNIASGILGVYPAGKKWRARITIQKRPVPLGIFDSKEQAHAAYLNAKRAHHEGCTI